MIVKRPFDTLEFVDRGRLQVRRHLSPSSQDPSRTHWGGIRLWNDDRIEPRSGFPSHPHRNVEIVTYVRSGAITHRDSLGNEGRTIAGEVAVMSAGTGVLHAESNQEDEATTLFQIWIEPRSNGGDPAWSSRSFAMGVSTGGLVTLASGFAEDADALPIRADATVMGATLRTGESVTHRIAMGRHAYLVPSIGSVQVEDEETRVILEPRDGASMTAGNVRITALTDAEIIMVDAD